MYDFRFHLGYKWSGNLTCSFVKKIYSIHLLNKTNAVKKDSARSLAGWDHFSQNIVQLFITRLGPLQAYQSREGTHQFQAKYPEVP